MHSNWRLPSVIGAILGLAWLMFISLAPPRLPGGDVYCFKDPGINFATGRGLVSRLNPGNVTLELKLNSHYPPLFAIVYAGFVCLFGVGQKADEIFDFLGIAFASFMFWFFVTSRMDRKPSPASLTLLLLLLLALPVGPFWSQRERPDALSFILILASMLFVQMRQLVPGFFLAGLVAGLNGCLSPFGCILNIAALALFGAMRLAQRSQLRIGAVSGPILLCFAGLLMPLVSMVFAAYQIDPEAVTRFVHHASGESIRGEGGLGYVAAALKGDFSHFASAITRYDSARYKIMGAHLVVVGLAAIFFVFWHQRSLARPHLRWIAFAIPVMALIPVLLFPYQPCYMSFTATVIVALLLRFARANAWNPLKCEWLAVVLIALVLLPAGAFLGRELILSAKAAPSNRQMDQIISAQEPPAALTRPFVSCTAANYFSFRSRRFEVVEFAYLERPEHIRQMDYFAIPKHLEASFLAKLRSSGIDAATLEVIHSATDDYSSILLNPRLFYTWQSSIYRRPARPLD